MASHKLALLLSSAAICQGASLTSLLAHDTLVLPTAAATVGVNAWDRERPLMVLAPGATEHLIAYNTSAGGVVVVRLDQGSKSLKTLYQKASQRVAGITYTSDGWALSSVENDSMLAVRRLTGDSTQVFRTLLTGTESRNNPDAKTDPLYWGTGRLSWNGTQLAAYFAHQQNYGTATTPEFHQGDMLAMFDASGAMLSNTAWNSPNGWSWGTSHSLDLDFLYDGRRWATLSLGDAYPKGVQFRRAGKDGVVLFALDADMSGWANGILGQLVQHSTNLYSASFASPQGRAGQDAAVVFFDSLGVGKDTVWLTALPAGKVKVQQIKSVLLGNDLLVVWNQRDTVAKTDSYQAALLDSSGTILQGPETFPVVCALADNIMRTPDGGISWAYPLGSKMIWYHMAGDGTPIQSPSWDYIQSSLGPVLRFDQKLGSIIVNGLYRINGQQ